MRHRASTWSAGLAALLALPGCATDMPRDAAAAEGNATPVEAAEPTAEQAAEAERAKLRACMAEYAAQFRVPEAEPPAEAPLTPEDSAALGRKAPAPAGEPAPPAAARPKFRAGEDPAYAVEHGWPVPMPDPLPGSVLPCERILVYYGNPRSDRMGILGEYPKEEMLRRFDAAIAEWNAADPAHPVRPALQLVTLVAQGDPGPTGKYRLWMPDTLVKEVHGWAKEKNALLILDLQVGTSTVQEEVPRIEHFLVQPDVHLALDPEFAMKDGSVPGRKIGTMDAAEINWTTEYLAGLVRKHGLPPKLLVIHRFTRKMVTNADKIVLRPEVQIIMDMDGWGAAWLKRDSYKDYIVQEPVQFTGFKIFYHNDVRKEGWTLMPPSEVLKLRPAPLYIQYQ